MRISVYRNSCSVVVNEYSHIIRIWCYGYAVGRRIRLSRVRTPLVFFFYFDVKVTKLQIHHFDHTYRLGLQMPEHMQQEY